jgi:hypothetical protein
MTIDPMHPKGVFAWILGGFIAGFVALLIGHLVPQIIPAKAAQTRV